MDHYGTLIDVESLAARLGQPDWSILDCRFDLSKPDWGRDAYLAAHVPGAHRADLDRDLAGAVGYHTGRHPLPDPLLFAQRLGTWGIDSTTQVVVYDQGNAMYAGRAWWLLRWLGHYRVAVLDGGFAAWRGAGKPMSTEVPPPDTRRFEPRIQDSMVAGTDDVQKGLESATVGVVDARGADRFAGQNETIDPVAGHVPGAANHPYTRNLDADGRFLPVEQLRSRWQETLGDRPASDWISMCGSGVSACHNLVAMEHAGLGGAKLYAGSWSEWIRDPQRGVAQGPT